MTVLALQVVRDAKHLAKKKNWIGNAALHMRHVHTKHQLPPRHISEHMFVLLSERPPNPCLPWQLRRPKQTKPRLGSHQRQVLV